MAGESKLSRWALRAPAPSTPGATIWFHQPPERSPSMGVPTETPIVSPLSVWTGEGGFFPGLLPAFLDDALREQGVDYPSPVVMEQANDVAHVQLLVDKEVANLDRMGALEI